MKLENWLEIMDPKDQPLFPMTPEDRYNEACIELDEMLARGELSQHEYYMENRNLEREFYGDDYDY